MMYDVVVVLEGPRSLVHKKGHPTGVIKQRLMQRLFHSSVHLWYTCVTQVGEVSQVTHTYVARQQCRNPWIQAGSFLKSGHL